MARPMPQFRDARMCPDCGGLAQRIGFTTVDHAGGEPVFEWHEWTVYHSCGERHKHAQPYQVHSRQVVYGKETTTAETRYHFPLDVWCTEPLCGRVAPLHATEPWVKPLPDWCMEPEGAVSHRMPVFGEGTT